MLRNNTKTILWSGFEFHKTKTFDIHIVASCIPPFFCGPGGGVGGANKSNIQRGKMPNKKKNSFKIKEKEWEK